MEEPYINHIAATSWLYQCVVGYDSYTQPWAKSPVRTPAVQIPQMTLYYSSCWDVNYFPLVKIDP